MSLPAANKAVSDNPAPNSVAQPTNSAKVEKDVDRKLRLYGVIQAFRNGRMPDNAQIDETLIYARDHAPFETDKLSHEGKKLVQDTREIIETARLMVKEKNADEIFQQFIYHTSDTQFKDKATSTQRANADGGITKEDAQKHSREALGHLRTLYKLLLTNSELRKLLQDFTVIGRDLLAQGAQHAAGLVKPDPDRLAAVNESAPSRGWTGDSPTRPTATADTAAAQSIQPVQPPIGGANSIPTVTTQTAPVSSGINGATPVVPPLDTDLSKSKAERVTSGDEVAASPGSPTSTAKKSFMSRFSSVKAKVPEKHRQTASEQAKLAKDKLAREFPEERRDLFINRLKKVVVECQEHHSYQTSIIWFLDTVEQYFSTARSTSSKTKTHASGLFSSDPVLQQAADEGRTLLERFADGKSLQGIFDAIDQLWEDAKADEELRAWWSRVDEFIRKSLLEPGFIVAPEFTYQSKTLRKEAHGFFDEKYKGHKDALFDAGQDWTNGFKEDKLNKRFGDDWARLTKDLLFDDEGSLTFKPHLWQDIRTIIVPALAKKVGYIPIPRIEYTDRALDLVIENLTLQGRNLFPNIIEIAATNYAKLSPYSTIKDSSHHALTLTLTQIQADMRDVAFYFRRKSGLPRIKDAGLADVFIGGEGITIKVKLVSQTGAERKKGDKSLFSVKSVNVKVHQLKFSIRDSKHDLLYKTLRPLATGLIKRQVAKAIADGIRTGFEYADNQLVSVRDRMAQDDRTKTQMIKDTFSKKSTTSAASSSSASSEVEATVSSKRSSKFKIVPRRESMLIPEAGHEQGWIKKQEEREHVAGEGEGWKSKAFSIVPSVSATA